MKTRGPLTAAIISVAILGILVARSNFLDTGQRGSVYLCDSRLLGAGFGLFSGSKEKKTLLSGRILDAETAEPVAAVITFPDHEIEPLVSDPFTGEFEVVLKPGVYRVRVESQGYKWKEKGVALNKGDKKVLDFTLAKGTQARAHVAGTVKDAGDNEVLSGVEVLVSNPEYSKSYHTDILGVFKIFIEPGEYNVAFAKEGYVDADLNISLAEGAYQQLDIVLSKVDSQLVTEESFHEDETLADSTEISSVSEGITSEDTVGALAPSDTVPEMSDTVAASAVDVDTPVTYESGHEAIEPQDSLIVESETPAIAGTLDSLPETPDTATSSITLADSTTSQEVTLEEIEPPGEETLETSEPAIDSVRASGSLSLAAEEQPEESAFLEDIQEAADTTETIPQPGNYVLSVDTTSTGARYVRIPPPQERHLYKTPDVSSLSEPALIQVPEFGNIQFEPGSAVITQQSLKDLEEVLEFLSSNPTIGMEIGGHTDSIGDDETNMAISEARAESVKKWLVDKGINPSRLDAQGYGETKPVADNRTRSGQAANRRIEFTILLK